MYRFGDGTPFPLRENFIETLVAAVDCGVALFQIEAQVEEHEARMREARRWSADELRRLDALEQLIENALGPVVGKEERTGRVSEQAAARILEAATTILRNSRTSVARRRETAEQVALPRSVPDAVVATLSKLVCSHQLPRTEWQAHWLAGDGVGGAATAELRARATRELELVFRAAFPADSFWARPIAMSDLFRGEVVATAKAGRPRQIRLDPTLLTEVQVAPNREAMVLRESNKRPGPALHILMPRPGEAGPLVVQVDKHDQARGQPFYLDDASTGAVMGAWRALERELPGLVAARQELVAARLGGRAVSEIEHPAQLAENILLSMAPLVREIRMRSRVPGELVLKRDLGPDRREELYVPRQALWSRVAGLLPLHRQVFEAIGLSNEATSEFVTRVAPRPSAPRAAESAPEAEPTERRADSEVSAVSGVIDRASA